MAKRQYQKVKEPVRIRFKELANGNRSIYLDTYTDGKRAAEGVPAALPHPRTDARRQNPEPHDTGGGNGNQGQTDRELTIGKAGINKHKGKILLSVWLEEYQKSLETNSRSLRSVTRRVGEMLLKYGGKDVRSAFLFSCFCGLRLCDIKNLQWKHIKAVNKTPMVEIYQQKTSEPLYLPLSDAAVKNLPPRADREEFVFTLPSHGIVNKHIHRWTEAAGITDCNITFHTARHTFATLNLTAGVDLYTVSKLLDHTEIRTTQIYAEVVNSAKIEAVNKVSDIFKTKGGEYENQ